MPAATLIHALGGQNQEINICGFPCDVALVALCGRTVECECAHVVHDAAMCCLACCSFLVR